MTPEITLPNPTAETLGRSLGQLRATPPLVQCLTNIVVAQWTANVLLAAGAAPAMVDNAHESAEFAAFASGVLINLGTPYDETWAAMAAAAASADAHNTPWVLDPVAAGGLTWRTSLALELLDTAHPTIIRGNASEILALAGGSGGKGVDSVDTPEAAADVARSLAQHFNTVVAVSGPIDLITDGERLVRLNNGHPWMTQVTGVGCALGALMAGFAGIEEDPLVAAAAATALLTVAADAAALESRGPGSFSISLIDHLSLLTPDGLVAAVRIE